MGTRYSSAAAEDSAVVAVSYLDEVVATNTSASTRYLHIFTGVTALPANGTAPDVCIAVPTVTTVSYDPVGTRWAVGPYVAIALSATAATLTVTTASEGVFSVR